VRERTVVSRPFCRLVHFERAQAASDDPKILLVAPLSGHYATLLRGTVAALLPDHEIYVTDWANGRDVALRHGRFDLDDYIAYVIDFLRHLGPGNHAIAVCQPSVPVLAATALLAAAKDPSQPRSLTLMGGPIDTRINPTVPNRLAEEHSLAWFEANAIHAVPWPLAGHGRRVYPGFLQLTGFMTMNLDRHLKAHRDLFDHLVQGDGESADAHRRFYDEYLSVMDLPAEYYLQTVRTVFQRHALATGTMTWRGRPVEPGAIENCGLLAVEGELDDISGVGQTKAALGLCRNVPAAAKHYHLQAATGHYGIFNGRRWRDEICPRVARFIREHR
jgi:poly(3-hydroxybutyrate) depolymerase